MRGRPLLIGEELDEQVRHYITLDITFTEEVGNRVINASINVHVVIAGERFFRSTTGMHIRLNFPS